ncbi:MerR family transcriptional regulator [Shouchella clausii]|uniref:MerR family transcriptional regulator n=1 Tax=Shouchella clausii TaxID=79880 RepID=UPI000BA543AB|nr:MerR family transcriptional regulator [Shouchella clausii]PAD08770.1 MerR family transcriptional regulator [Shouchella clausii]
MEYTVKKLAQLAGVSARTLRYYDEIGLLKPERVNSSGYRIYGQKQVDLLQQILFYRELDVDLETIMQLVTDDSFDPITALYEHRAQLLNKRARLDRIIDTVERTIASKKGAETMSDKDKFDALKEKRIADNEKTFGEEIRQKYGDKTVDESNAKFRGLSKEQYDAMQAKEQEVFALLKEALATNDPTSETARKLAQAHKEWLQFSWASYSKEAHAGVAKMYVDDERFAAYYNKAVPGGAVFLRDAILAYLQ